MVLVVLVVSEELVVLVLVALVDYILVEVC